MFSVLVSCVKVALILGVAGWLLTGLLREPDRSWLRQRALWIMPAIYTVAMFSPSIWVIFGLMFLVLPLGVKRREDVAPLLPFAFLGIPLMTQDIRVGGSALLTLTSWHCVFLGGLLALSVQRRTEPAARISGISIMPFVMLYVVSVITMVHGVNATTALRSLIETLILYGIPFLIAARGLKSPADIRRFVAAFMIAIALQAVIGIYQSRAYWPIYENIFWSTGIPLPKLLAVKMRAGMMRATASYLESNSLAGLCAFGFILVLAARNVFRSAMSFQIAALVMLVGIYATVSRGGFVFAGVAWLGFEAYRGKFARVGTSIVAMGALYGVAAVAGRYVAGLAAFTGASEDSQGTADYRRQLFDRGIEEIMRSPVVGYDWPTIKVVMADLRQGEGIVDFVNGYILAGMTGGVGAMLLLFMLFVAAAYQVYRVRDRMPDDTTARIAAACFGVQVATIVTCFTSGFFGSASVPYAITLGVGALLTSKTIQRSARPSAFVPARTAPLPAA